MMYGMQEQLNEAIAKTGQLSAVSVQLIDVSCAFGVARVVWVAHNFDFLGGSLGCAEGEKITRVGAMYLYEQQSVFV